MLPFLATCTLIAGSGVAPVPAQDALGHPQDAVGVHPAPDAAAAGCGFVAEGAGWTAIGPRYKAHLDGRGAVFTPALGGQAPRSFPLRYELLDVGRDGGWIAPLASRAGVEEALGLTVQRDATFDERWDVTPRGLEHSLVFRTLPPGNGDLVARVAVETDLPLAASDGDRVSFLLPELGGVTVDSVLGIDAAGKTAAGSIDFVDGLLELRLPAEFVERAALPLVLDPLIGTDLAVATSFDASQPDAAFGASTYLVVWEEVFSGIDSDIRAQRMSTSNTFVGATFDLQSAGDVAIRPTVAFCNQSDSWLVAWQQGPSLFGPWDILGRGVRSDGTLMGSVTIASDAANELDPDAGGDRLATDDDVLVVWEREGGGIRGAQVTVPALTSTLFVVSTFTVTTTSNDHRPAISKSGGDSGRFMVVWERFIFGFPFGDNDVVGRLVDRNGNLLGPEMGLQTSTLDERDPDVDGDGSRWMVAYEREESDGSDFDIYARLWGESGGVPTALTTIVAVENDDDDDEVDPAVGWSPTKFAVAFLDQSGSLAYHVFARGLDPNTCLECEPESVIALDNDYTLGIELAPRWAAGSSSDGALMVWAAHDLSPGFAGDIRSQLWQAHDGGSSSNLGGGCGSGGTIKTQGPVAIGNQDFLISVSAADPMAVVGFLNLSVPGAPTFGCGACAWNPWQVVQSTTLVAGNGEIPTPVPCNASLSGASLEAQWTVLFTGVSPCSLSPNVSLSDRLLLTFDY